MTNPKQIKLLSLAKDLTSMDSEVFRKHVKNMAKLNEELTKIEDSEFHEEHLTTGNLNSLEAIITGYGRPVFFIENDRIMISDSKVWQERLSAYADVLSENSKRVGRVEVEGHPYQDYLESGEEFFLGTCFVIGSEMLLTNRHVATEFCQPNGQIKSGMTPRVDFVEEVKRDLDNEIRIIKAIEIGKDFDYAILQVEGAKLPSPVEFATSTEDINADRGNTLSYIVGYPAFDTRNPTDLQNKLFDGKFNVKRLAPGRLRKIVGPSSYVGHERVDRDLVLDYTSLGGNSGSPVFDLETGLVIGLHYAGRYAEANYAVPIWSILDRIQVHIDKPKEKISQITSNNYIERLLTERVMYMPLGKAKAIASGGFNPQSVNEVTNAAAASIVLGFFGQNQLQHNLTTALSAIHPSLSTAIGQIFRSSEKSYYPRWDDWSPASSMFPQTLSPTFQPTPFSPFAYNTTESADSTCISSTIGGAMVGGVSGFGSAGPIGATIGALGGGLAGAAAGGCFK